jgi:hypothetical protein
VPVGGVGHGHLHLSHLQRRKTCLETDTRISGCSGAKAQPPQQRLAAATSTSAAQRAICPSARIHRCGARAAACNARTRGHARREHAAADKGAGGAQGRTFLEKPRVASWCSTSERKATERGVRKPNTVGLRKDAEKDGEMCARRRAEVSPWASPARPCRGQRRATGVAAWPLLRMLDRRSESSTLARQQSRSHSLSPPDSSPPVRLRGRRRRTSPPCPASSAGWRQSSAKGRHERASG